MAIYRNIQMSFWTDTKVVEEFTPEDRYFYLYLMTNPHTNLSGCYEVGIKKMADELGYAKDVVERLIKRFYEVHHLCAYDYNTHEMLITNWYKYNWTSSEKFRLSLLLEFDKIKNPIFREYLSAIYEGNDITFDFIYGTDTVSVGYQNGSDNVPVCSSLGYVYGNGMDMVMVSNQESNKENEVLFEKLWALYPKKRGKGQVSKTQKAKLAKIGEEELKRCIARFKTQIDKEHRDMKYVMQGSTFFNSGYVDYLDSNYVELPTSNSTSGLSDVDKEAFLNG